MGIAKRQGSDVAWNRLRQDRKAWFISQRPESQLPTYLEDSARDDSPTDEDVEEFERKNPQKVRAWAGYVDVALEEQGMMENRQAGRDPLNKALKDPQLLRKEHVAIRNFQYDHGRLQQRHMRSPSR